ncbi:MAG TPA: F0F1 ATP synthase subunit gamma [Phycisphaerales bacterium]|nr:F0F1 ATP synthase subunit gamma [Phycisphaerales bacterium]
MDTLEALQKRLETAGQLRIIVRVMKSLAAASIRQFERAAVSMTDYRNTVELGLTAGLRGVSVSAESALAVAAGSIGMIVVGSDQGLCGPLNDHLAAHAVLALQRAAEAMPDSARGRAGTASLPLIVVGSRAAARLAESGLRTGEALRTPASAEGITGLVQELLTRLDQTIADGAGTILVVYNEHLPGAGFEPRDLRLLPLDRRWIEEVQAREWPSRLRPIFTIERPALLKALLREYLFASLFLAVASSLASEYASRLSSMQAAERNIEERSQTLGRSYRERRQSDIDAELMDIIGGFEALGDASRP